MRHREQARSHSGLVYICERQVGCQAAIAGKPAPTVKLCTSAGDGSACQAAIASKLSSYEDEPGDEFLRCWAWAQITRRRSSSAERHSRISSTWRKQPRQTFCSSSRQTLVHGDGTAALTLLYSGLGARVGAASLTRSQPFEIEFDVGLLLDDALKHLTELLFALVTHPALAFFVVV